MGQQSKAKAARRAARQEFWSPVLDRDGYDTGTRWTDAQRVRAFIAGRRSGKWLTILRKIPKEL